MKRIKYKITKHLKPFLVALTLLAGVQYMGSGVASAFGAKGSSGLTKQAFITVSFATALRKKGVKLGDDAREMIEGLDDELNEKLGKLTEGVITKEEFDEFLETKQEAIAELVTAKTLKVGEGDDAKTVEEMFRHMGTQITNLKKMSDENRTAKVVTIADLIEKGAKEVLGKDFEGDALKALQKIKENKTGFIEIHIKDAATMTISGSTSSSPTDVTNPYKPLIDTSDVVEIRQQKEFVFQLVDLGSTNEPVLIWTEEVGGEGDIELVTEGNLKPLQDFDFQDYISKYKKAAGYISLTDELITDLPRLTTAIKRLFKKKVMRQYHDFILADMIAVAPTYVATSLDDTIANPDNYAAIGAATVQMNDSNAYPDTLVMNHADVWAMRLQKDNTGQYIIPPLTAENGTSIAGYRVFTSGKIAVGKFLLVESGVYEVDEYEGYTVRMGYVNDDLIKNKFSMVGELKYHSKIPTNEKVALFYGDFAVIKAALDSAEVENP